MIVVLMIVIFGRANVRDNVNDGPAELIEEPAETPVVENTPEPPPEIDNTPVYNPDQTWAIYWYLCGSDLETRGGFATSDIDEMLQVTSLPENITIVIEAGGARQWQNGIDPNSNSRFVYDKDGYRLVEQNPAANMGDRYTLESFLRFCTDNYPADNQVVIFWNHGGGSVSGVIFDERYGFSSLTLPQIHQAFEAVTPPSHENPPFELVTLDACLMATIDMAATLNGFSRWMVASQELVPACGWDYHGFLQALVDDPGMSGMQLGMAICDTFFNDCSASGNADDITISLIDLCAIDNLLSAYVDIGAESLFSACNDITFFGEYGRAARKAISFGGNNAWDGYTNMVDLGDLVRNADVLLPEYGNALLDALDECVVYMLNGPLRKNATGLSFYYSYNSDYEDLRSYISRTDDTPFHWFYDYNITGELSDEGMRYVESLMREYSRPPEITRRIIPSTEEFNLDGHPLRHTSTGDAVLELDPAIVNALSGIYCYIAYFDIDNEIILLLGRVNNFDADWERGVFSDTFDGMWGCIDDTLVFMELTEIGDDYLLYSIPVKLNGEEHSISVSYSYATGEYEILGARRGIDDNGMADRITRSLVPGDVIEPLHYALFDMDDYDEEFTIMAVESLVVTENTRFHIEDMGDGYFIYIYEMVDLQNNSFLSEPAAFLVEDGLIYLLELDMSSVG